MEPDPGPAYARVPLDDLTPHPRNVRIGDVGAIVESLRAFGQYRPIVAQPATNGGPAHILAGSHTWRAHRALATEDPERWGTIDVVWAPVDDETAIRIMLADNRTADLAHDDGEALAALLAELGAPAWAGTGWDGDDLDTLLHDLNLPDGSSGDGEAPVRTVGPSLMDRFVVPPFSVLDSRQGYWQERKRQWLSLGIRSELGRGEGLTYDDSDSVGDTDFYARKRDAEAALGRPISRAEFAALTPEERDEFRGGRRPAKPLLGMGDSPAMREVWNNMDPGSATDGHPTRDGKPPRQTGTKRGKGRALVEDLQAGEGKVNRQTGRARDRAQVFGHGDENPAALATRYAADQRSNVTGAPPMPAYADIGMVNAAPGTSIFDPVLCEVAYRWFTPPGGTVLDPFAGGSVRGIVAAVLGRRYVGIDLSAPQVAANREQAAAILGGSPGFMSDPEALTPVERHGDIWMKRDDLYAINGATGGKARATLALAKGAAGLVSVSARTSPQNARAARVAAHLGIPARCHTGVGEDTDETRAVIEAGAELIRHVPARLAVMKARARQDAEERPGWVLIPFGASSAASVAQARAQAANVPPDAERIVVPVGSGTTLAGILAATSLPVLGVVCGGDPTATLDEHAPGWRSRVEMVPSGLPFEAHAPETSLDGVPLDPTYEAKCLPFIRPGDLLWVVGGPQAPAMTPRWVVGDSADVLDPPDITDHTAGGGTMTLGPNPYPPEPVDLVFSCPPYFDLERYTDDPRDLSAMDWPAFVVTYRHIIRGACSRLRDDRFAAFVVSDIRDPRGLYRGLPALTIEAFRDAGLALYNEAAFINAAGSLPMRAAKQFIASRKLGRSHQQMLVFVKGDPAKATAACGPVVIDEALFSEPQPDMEDPA